jgi:hypothetical protein
MIAAKDHDGKGASSTAREQPVIRNRLHISGSEALQMHDYLRSPIERLTGDDGIPELSGFFALRGRRVLQGLNQTTCAVAYLM